MKDNHWNPKVWVVVNGIGGQIYWDSSKMDPSWLGRSYFVAVWHYDNIVKTNNHLSNWVYFARNCKVSLGFILRIWEHKMASPRRKEGIWGWEPVQPDTSRRPSPSPWILTRGSSIIRHKFVTGVTGAVICRMFTQRLKEQPAGRYWI